MRFRRGPRGPLSMTLLAVSGLVAAGVAGPVAPANAAAGCEVTYQGTHWTEGPEAGGFQADITIENLGDPIRGWTLAFTLPAGQSFRRGWSAEWAGATGDLTAGSLPWNADLGTGESVRIGFLGGWTGDYTEPTSFRVTGCGVTEPPTSPPPTVTLTNPYQDAEVYVDPDWAALVSAQATTTPGELGQRMARVATYPTAVWLDSIGSLTDGRGLAGHLDQALLQRETSGADAMVVQLVLYNAPGRDCLRRGAPGELSVTDGQRYRTEYVDPIVDILGRPEYADLRVVAIIEPGAVEGLVVGRQVTPLLPSCEPFQEAYTDAVRYALARLSELDNTYSYLDFSFSGFFGYPDNGGPAADLYADLVLGPDGPGAGSVTGFATNVRHYAPLAEPFLPDPDLLVGGQAIYQSLFFDWNRQIHELDFAQAVRNALVAAGFSPTIGMLVDTSRNGWGGPDRPTQPSASTDLNSFVDQSRIDRRPTRVSWCNQIGAGIGARPQAAPEPGVHAYAWITPPGESDGVADPSAPPDPDQGWLTHRQRCDPLWQAPQARLIPSNALPDAPHAGRWFPRFFAQLVSNAHPPVPVD